MEHPENIWRFAELYHGAHTNSDCSIDSQPTSPSQLSTGFQSQDQDFFGFQKVMLRTTSNSETDSICLPGAIPSQQTWTEPPDCGNSAVHDDDVTMNGLCTPCPVVPPYRSETPKSYTPTHQDLSYNGDTIIPLRPSKAIVRHDDSRHLAYTDPSEQGKLNCEGQSHLNEQTPPMTYASEHGSWSTMPLNSSVDSAKRHSRQTSGALTSEKCPSSLGRFCSWKDSWLTGDKAYHNRRKRKNEVTTECFGELTTKTDWLRRRSSSVQSTSDSTDEQIDNDVKHSQSPSRLVVGEFKACPDNIQLATHSVTHRTIAQVKLMPTLQSTRHKKSTAVLASRRNTSSSPVSTLRRDRAFCGEQVSFEASANSPCPSLQKFPCKQENKLPTPGQDVPSVWQRGERLTADGTADSSTAMQSTLCSERPRRKRKLVTYGTGYSASDVSYTSPRSVEDEVEDSKVSIDNRGRQCASLKWSDDDSAKLMRLRALGYSWRALADALGRSNRACQLKYTQLSKQGTFYFKANPGKIAQLMELYTQKKVALWNELALEIGCSPRAAEDMVLDVLKKV